MTPPKVFFVHLRRPRPNDPRSDPFYEFGSFGCTKCHCRNLFHPRHADDLDGSRLAFVQGGNDGTRLVFLTPPIAVKVWEDSCEACWSPHEMPFKYSEAPILVASDGRSDFSLVKSFANRANRSTLEGCFSSRIRALSRPLASDMAKQVITVYKRFRNQSRRSAIAKFYFEALPYVAEIDHHRRKTYNRLQSKLYTEINGLLRTRIGQRIDTVADTGSKRCSSLRRQSGRTERCT